MTEMPKFESEFEATIYDSDGSSKIVTKKTICGQNTPELEIEILDDGSISVERRSVEHNDKVYDILSSMVDMDHLNNFFHMSKEREVLFGDYGLCG